jgi:hypothetical protein
MPDVVEGFLVLEFLDELRRIRRMNVPTFNETRDRGGLTTAASATRLPGAVLFEAIEPAFQAVKHLCFDNLRGSLFVF